MRSELARREAGNEARYATSRLDRTASGTRGVSLLRWLLSLRPGKQGQGTNSLPLHRPALSRSPGRERKTLGPRAPPGVSTAFRGCQQRWCRGFARRVDQRGEPIRRHDLGSREPTRRRASSTSITSTRWHRFWKCRPLRSCARRSTGSGFSQARGSTPSRRRSWSRRRERPSPSALPTAPFLSCRRDSAP